VDRNARWWRDKISASTEAWGIEYCYCSVFHDCWEVRDRVQREVKQCRRDEKTEFAP
jgi:hypothetical protein